MSNNQEIELKFALADNVSIEYIHDLLGKIGKVGPIVVDNLSNTYFDNENGDFTANKAGLRIRRANEYTEMTLKVSKKQSTSLHQRAEYNVPLTRDYKKPPLEQFPLEVQIFLQENDLLTCNIDEIANIKFTRSFFTYENDTGVYEFAKDEGDIVLKDGSLPIHELEIEIKSFTGDEKDLYMTLQNIVKVLSDNNVPITTDPFSKLSKSLHFKEYLKCKDMYLKALSMKGSESICNKSIAREAIRLIKNRAPTVIEHLMDKKCSLEKSYIRTCYDLENMLGVYRITNTFYYLTLAKLSLDKMCLMHTAFLESCTKKARALPNGKFLMHELSEAQKALCLLQEKLDLIISSKNEGSSDLIFDDHEFVKAVFIATASCKVAFSTIAVKSTILYLNLD